MRGWQMRWIASDMLEKFPAVYTRVLRFRWAKSLAIKRIVHLNSELMIVGYPRCANSFALAAFRSVNGGSIKLRVATHVHSPAQVRQAIRWSIPCLVLIRKPDLAIPSLIAYAVQLNKIGRRDLGNAGGRDLVSYWSKRYINFYRQLLPCAECIQFADFIRS